MLELCAALVVTVAPITPVGDAEIVKWRKDDGYVVGAAALAFELEGPKSIAIDLRANEKKVTIEIVEDGVKSSVNEVICKPKGNGPAGYKNECKLALEVPAGKHTYAFSSQSGPVVVKVAESKRFLKKFAVAAWTPKAAPAAAEPEAEPAPKAEEAALASAPPAQPETPAAPPTDKEREQAEMEAIMATSSEVVQSLAASSDGGASDAAASSGGLQAALRVAVYNLDLEGVSPQIGSVVNDSLLAEVRKLKHMSAIGMDEIEDMLSHEANKQMLGCEASESCLAEIAGALGVDNLVTGKLSKLDDGGSAFLLRRIDQRRAKVVGTVNKRLTGESGEEFLAAIGPSIEELFPNYDLREGTQRGVDKQLALRLNPPPLPAWSFWATAGGAALVGAAGGVFGLLANAKQSEYNTLKNQDVVEGRELKAVGDDLESRAGTANTLFIGAGVLAVTSGIMALFTDWHGYAEQAQQ